MYDNILLTVVVLFLFLIVMITVKALHGQKMAKDKLEKILRAEQNDRLLQYYRTIPSESMYFKSMQFFRMNNRGQHPCDEISPDSPIIYREYVDVKRYWQIMERKDYETIA